MMFSLEMLESYLGSSVCLSLSFCVRVYCRGKSAAPAAFMSLKAPIPPECSPQECSSLLAFLIHSFKDKFVLSKSQIKTIELLL